MKKINKLKKGFTLVELMIFFVFISLVLAASTPIITKRIRYIPDRVPHGKFVCYGGSHELYNNSRLIESGSGCNFKPPKKATLFKIELIGAGAGGYQWDQSVEEFMETKTKDFALSEVQSVCSIKGEGVTCPPNAILREVLKGAPFTIATRSPSAAAGEDVTETYVGVAYPSISYGVECWKPTPYECTKTRMVKKDTGEKDEEGNTIYEEVEEEYQTTCYTTQAEDNALDLYTCSEINSAISSIASNISSQRNCGANDWCKTLANENFISPYKQQVAWFDGMINGFGSPGLVARGAGAPGGSGVGLYVDGYIDFCDHTHYLSNACPHGNTQDERYVKDQDVRSYLSSLFTKSYKTGTVSGIGDCANMNYTAWYTFPDTKVEESTYRHGENGKQPRYYAAISTWANGSTQCVTNVDYPTGGEGGWIRINEGSSMIYGSNSTGSVLAGKDATEATFGTNFGPYKVNAGDAVTSKPSLSVYTSLSARRHTVGQGGGAAETPVVRYVTQLDDDCSFFVASGGPAINKNVTSKMIKQLEENLDTSLRCNDSTLYLSAKGGSYNPSTYSKTYHGFDYILTDGRYQAGNGGNVSSMETVDPGGISPYIPSDIFSKYELNNIHLSNSPNAVGAGGSGNRIDDPCLYPYGEYKVRSLYGSTTYRERRRQIDRTEDQQTKCDERSLRRENATSGSSGVIIISW